MKTVNEELANLFRCGLNGLKDRLTHPFFKQQAETHLKGMTLETTYVGQNGQARSFKFHSLSSESAHTQYAYNGFLFCTVRQHFYIKRRIRLQHPQDLCVVENCGNVMKYRYYPMELLKIVPTPKPRGKLTYSRILNHYADTDAILEKETQTDSVDDLNFDGLSLKENEGPAEVYLNHLRKLDTENIQEDEDDKELARLIEEYNSKVDILTMDNEMNSVD